MRNGIVVDCAGKCDLVLIEFAMFKKISTSKFNYNYICMSYFASQILKINNKEIQHVTIVFFVTWHDRKLA